MLSFQPRRSLPEAAAAAVAVVAAAEVEEAVSAAEGAGCPGLLSADRHRWAGEERGPRRDPHHVPAQGQEPAGRQLAHVPARAPVLVPELEQELVLAPAPAPAPAPSRARELALAVVPLPVI